MFDLLKEKFSSFAENASKKTISEKDLNKLLWDLELSLVENDVSLKVAEKIVSDLKMRLVGERIRLTENKKEFIENSLRKSIREILASEKIDFFKIIEENRKALKPTVILFLGFNGTGKTTTIAKIGKYLKERGYSCVIAASDTFRAGSIEQLERHAENVGIRVIKHQYGADAAAVAFDAISHAKSKGIDVVLIDTAGRAETNKNLMEEMKKIKRVTKPDLTIFVGDALAGNAVVEQAEKFGVVGIDASILTKIDADVRGGAALSISFATKKPILFICNGQGYSDLQVFDVEWFLEKLD